MWSTLHAQAIATCNSRVTKEPGDRVGVDGHEERLFGSKDQDLACENTWK